MAAPIKKVLVQSNLRLSADRETTMTALAASRFTLERQNLGWTSPRQYQLGSWMGKRYQSTQFSERDYSSRAAPGSIFSQSNLSLAAAGAMAAMHQDKIINDILASPKFFGLTGKSQKDDIPALPLAERYLQGRADHQDLLSKFRASLTADIKRGECVFKATKATIIKKVPVKAQLVLDGDGKPAKDSNGDYITADDIWKPMPNAAPGTMFLDRDPKTVMAAPVGYVPPLSNYEKVFVRSELALNGCDWDIPYWSDIVIPDNATSIDAADFRAHIFDAFPEDVINGLPQDKLNKKAVDQYLNQYANNGVGLASKSDAAQPALNRGEQLQTQDTDPNSPQKRTYIEVWWRWDADEDKSSENLMLLMDLDAQWPIAYDYAELILDWSEGKVHPFGCTRIYPIEHRWYGASYWEVMKDETYLIDWCLNNQMVDLSVSGNILFGNPQATEEGVAGVPYKFRGRRMYRSRGQFTPQDALHCVTVPSQAKPIGDMMNTSLQRVQLMGGNVASGETPVAGMPGEGTATAANIAQTQSDILVRARETEFVEGANPALRDFADIEFADYDPDYAAKLLGPDDAQTLSDWITADPGGWRNHIEVNMTKTRSTDVISTTMAKLPIYQAWDMMQPQDKTAARQQSLSSALQAMGDQDPEGALPLPPPPVLVGPDGQPLPVDPSAPQGQPQFMPPAAGAPATQAAQGAQPSSPQAMSAAA